MDLLGIYVVSLKESSSRRVNLKKQFPEFYPYMNIVDAINGCELDVSFYFKEMTKIKKKYDRILSPNELACTLSHVHVLKKFLKTNNKYALILEDDVIGEDAGIYELTKILKTIDLNGVLLCGGQEGLPADWYKFRYGAKCGANHENLFIVDPYSIKFYARSVCYVINRDFALSYIEKNSSIIFLADDWQEYLNSKKYKFYFKKIFSHPVDNHTSTIEKQRLLVGNNSTKGFNMYNGFVKKFFNKINNIFHLGVFKLKGLENIK